jgi:ABC-type bacteriocin/lantibiotic exporter with double-glycine peptidase domain
MTLQQALSGNPADKALPDQKHPPASQESRSKQAKQPRTTIWRLVDYLRPFWKNILLASICLLLSSAAGLSFPWIVQNLLDSVFIYHNKELRHIALWLVALFLLKSLFDFVQNYQVLYTGERLIVHMRKQVYEHLQALSLTFFDNWQTGEIMSCITIDVVVIQTGITSSALNLAQEIMMLIGSVLIIVLIDWRLTLLIALALPPPYRECHDHWPQAAQILQRSTARTGDGQYHSARNTFLHAGSQTVWSRGIRDQTFPPQS